MGFHNPSHPMHELELSGSHKPYTCDGCKEPGFGSRYRCRECDFDLHPDCMSLSESSRDPLSSHEYFPNSHFKFLTKPPRSCHDNCKRNCDACGKPILGFLYHCEKEQWDLHPCCWNLKKKYVIDDVELKLIHEKVRSKCIWCNKKNVRHSGVKGWSYVSECGKYHFHVSCVTEMVLEEARGGNWNGESLALEKVNLKAIQTRRKSGYGGRGNKYWRIVKVFFKTIACVLLGDPTITLACLLVDVLA